MLTELLRREKQLNIKPDPYIDALMKVRKHNELCILSCQRLKETFFHDLFFFFFFLFHIGISFEGVQGRHSHGLCS
jgi:hypothetical protein